MKNTMEHSLRNKPGLLTKYLNGNPAFLDDSDSHDSPEHGEGFREKATLTALPNGLGR